MKVARVILTTDCNFNCSYCCNKLPEVQTKFKMTTIRDLVKMPYDVFNLTGGEIGLTTLKLVSAIYGIKLVNPKAEIYLYTNGKLRPWDFGQPSRDAISGINVGFHPETDIDKIRVRLSDYIYYGLKPRVHIEDTRWESIDKEFKIFLERNNIPVKLWTRGQCMNDNEDWWIV